jgi:hypothetical protein
MRDSVHNARKITKTLQQHAAALKPNDVGIKMTKDEEVLTLYVNKLKKSRETYETIEDHLGFDSELENYLAAVKFLTGKALEPEVFRSQLWENDGDLRQAVLKAAGLDDPEHEKAFDSVLALKGLEKSEISQPKEIAAFLPEGEKIAKEIEWSFANNEVQPVKLAGKHSKGMMMANGPDQDLFLIKPGSGKNSVAAGASEEQATQSRREACYYQVAKAWGIDVVPEAQLILLDHREVAVFRMLGLDWTGLHRSKSVDPNLPQTALKQYLNSGEIFHWSVLDYVCGNPDRHGQNIMVSPADEGNKIALIDHGSAFASDSFDPGGDKNSFVPYYLRVWSSESKFNSLSTKQKLSKMPVLHPEADAKFKEWILSLDPKELAQILNRFGIRPEPSVKRLLHLQSAVQGTELASLVVNRFWTA